MREKWKDIRQMEVLNMIGVTRAEIVELNSINLIDYLLETDGNNYRKRSNGTIVHKAKDNVVIYADHSYNFGTTIHAYKDAIGTIRDIYGYDFMTAVNKLRAYRDKHNYTDEKGNQAIPKYNIFDDL